MLLKNARENRKNMPFAEVILWQRLRELRSLGFHFRRQVTKGKYIFDFACLKSRLLIEIDGDNHFHAIQIIIDEAKMRYAHNEGYKVIRFTNNDIYENCEGVVEEIIRIVNLSHPNSHL